MRTIVLLIRSIVFWRCRPYYRMRAPRKARLFYRYRNLLEPVTSRTVTQLLNQPSQLQSLSRIQQFIRSCAELSRNPSVAATKLKLTTVSFPHNFELSFSLAGLLSHTTCARVGSSIISAHCFLGYRTFWTSAFGSATFHYTIFV